MTPDILKSIQDTVTRASYFRNLTYNHKFPDMFQETLPKLVPGHREGLPNREIWLGTSIRKKASDGKWYLIPILETFYTEDSDQTGTALSNCFKRFFFKVGENILFYKVDGMKNLTDANGLPVIMIDPDQAEQIPLYQQLMNKAR